MPTLEWIGKDKVINHHQKVPFMVLEEKYTYNAEKSDNMIIRGDNLEALKALLPKYEGRIKCIYIDPPYNTGNEGWVYNDNVNDPKIRKWLGEVVGKEGEDLSRHDKWLCMMYPRLKLLYKLLSNDGAIFISLDYHEQPFLRIMLDEIFGANNFVSEIACVNKPSGRSDDKYIATAHESIIIYHKTDNFEMGGFPPDDKIIKRYTKTDTDRRLYREEDLRKRGSHDERKDRPNLFYPFFYREADMDLIIGNNEDATPEGYIKIVPMKSQNLEGTWRWGRETAQELKKYIHPRYMPNKEQWSIFEWQYLDERGDVKPTSVWDYKDVNSERGTEVFSKYLGFKSSDFPNPKPVGTIERIIRIATDKDSIILDSFAGSGTTAHAVLNMNKADGGNRKFILVEMMDYADSITAERVKRVIDGYGEGKNAVEGTGGDFTFYDLGQALLLSDGNLNEDVETGKIREYIWYTETKTPFAPPDTDNPYYLGKHNDTGYYFYYEKERLTTLNHEYLATIAEKAESYLIYADLCTIPDEELKRYNIIFKKIPRDIAKL
ncbi:site-specific DNA-methyltransferase [Ruminococcus difficilis]|uniref:Site-specific DNA-methyltransferase n=1 Tax=Ruminococcus difficilis TaxID=2763069 RepID=A0A934U2Z6_9FIRM|nr:site-specific DNA-methyltransferase [Ruminococcus difficilis]MBK6087414.1 site-specific DNA-methyltransferase [Ruminococcus difficilis]